MKMKVKGIKGETRVNSGVVGGEGGAGQGNGEVQSEGEDGEGLNIKVKVMKVKKVRECCFC